MSTRGEWARPGPRWVRAHRLVAVVLAVGTTGAVGLSPRTGYAHEFRPALLTIEERAPGLLQVTWTRDRGPAAEHMQPVLPAHCRATAPPRPRRDGPVVIQSFAAVCTPTGLAGARVAVDGLASSARSVVVNVTTHDGRGVQATLHASATAVTLDVDEHRSNSHSARVYGQLGVKHILTGIDHLAFIAMLLVIIGLRARRLLVTITAFTAAHSITLGLTVVGLVSVPAAPVEILIALSIVWLALEVAHTDDHRTAVTDAPWSMAFAFGLLHGFGFSSALTTIGLPRDQIPMALLSFNLGVELGQLAFVAAALALYGACRMLASARLTGAAVHTLRTTGAKGLAYTVGGVACYWTFDRIVSMWRGGFG